MITTLNKIRENSLCRNGWEKLLKSLDKTQADDEPLSLMYVLESNGIEDAIWCLRCFDYKEYCLFLADVAESALSIYKEKYPEDNRVDECIKAIRDYHAGDVDIEFLKAAADVADAAADVADADAARKLKWKKIEALFVKHFGE